MYPALMECTQLHYIVMVTFCIRQTQQIRKAFEDSNIGRNRLRIGCVMAEMSIQKLIESIVKVKVTLDAKTAQGERGGSYE